jgi:hypothetical protein
MRIDIRLIVGIYESGYYSLTGGNTHILPKKIRRTNFFRPPECIDRLIYYYRKKLAAINELTAYSCSFTTLAYTKQTGI